MEIKVKKLRDDAIVPNYATSGSAGFDFYAVDDIALPPGSTTLIRTGLAFEIPIGYEMQIRPRSGLSLNTKLRVSNSPGTVDSDYRSEIGIIIDNISNSGVESYSIKTGDRIAQGVIKKVEKVSFVETEELSSTSRTGGFGSTGE